MKGYYVTARLGGQGNGQTAWLLGPFQTHRAALCMVHPVRQAARRLDDPRFEFAAYGTASITADTLPPGRLDLTKAVDDAWIGYLCNCTI